MAKKRLTDRGLKALPPANPGKRYDLMDSDVPGLGIRVTDRGRRTFVFLSRFPGSPNPTRRALGEYGAISLEEARNKARLWADMVQRGRDPRAEAERARLAEQQRRDDSFAAVRDEFIRLALIGPDPANLAHMSGWAAGELTALGVCIFSMVLSSLPSPRAVAPVTLKGTSIGVVAALVHRLAIQPHVGTVPALILSIIPFLLVGGLARASSKTAAPALDANMCFLLGSQAILPPVTDMAAVLSGTAALMLAVGIVAPAFMILPSGPERRAANAMRAIRRDLSRLTRMSGPVDPERLRARTGRQILRLSLHVERYIGLSRDPEISPLAALVLGNAIISMNVAFSRVSA